MDLRTMIYVCLVKKNAYWSTFVDLLIQYVSRLNTMRKELTKVQNIEKLESVLYAV